MRAVVQRVSEAAVRIGGATVASIDDGLLVLVGVADGDEEADVRYIVDKLVNLRVFPDEVGQMNRSVQEAGGQMLVVSQFTLMGDARRGRRPSWSAAASPDDAKLLYARVCEALRSAGVSLATGVFGATMDVVLTNRGPVTVLLDSRKAF